MKLNPKRLSSLSRNSLLVAFLAAFALGQSACLVAGQLNSEQSPAQADSTKPEPMVEAYRLMDQKENAKAIVILEQVVEDAPENEEARLLLASAYTGEAGIDVFSVYSSFQEVISSRPLGEIFLTDRSAAAAASEKPKSDEETKNSQLPEILRKLDELVLKFHQALVVLDRFPKVPKEKWPLLERALELTDPIGMPTDRKLRKGETAQYKDLSLYRLFVRVMYIKDYLFEEVVGADRDSFHAWACQLDLEKFARDLEWIYAQAGYAAYDYQRLTGERVSAFLHLKRAVNLARQELNDLEEDLPIEARITGAGLNNLVHEALACE